VIDTGFAKLKVFNPRYYLFYKKKKKKELEWMHYKYIPKVKQQQIKDQVFNNNKKKK
jgi:hypothetical protein